MPTVLHLIDAASPQATPATLALIAATRRHVRHADHRVLLLGGDAMQRYAPMAGLTDFQRIGVPGGGALLGAAAVAGALRGQSFDLIHAWSIGAWRLAGLLRRGTPRVLSLTQPLDDAAAARLARNPRSRRPPSRITVLSESMRTHLIGRGLDGSRLHAIAPAIDPSMLDPGRREGLRAAWGLDGPETGVLALLGDPPTAADARKANLGLGLAHESLTADLGRRPDARLLMHPDQSRRLAAYRLMVSYGVADLIDQESGLIAPWRTLPGCDAALIPAEHGGGLATCWAMAAGLAIVAENSGPADEWLRNEDNALIADRDQPKRLAHRLHQLIRDAPLAHRIGGQARRDAQRLFDPALYADRVAELYESLPGPA